MSETLPDTTCRLFAHYEDVRNLPTTSPELVIASLLEEGDSTDLRWLTRRFPESRLRSWMDRHGHRQLTRRSRSFWNLVLDRSEPASESNGNPLWPL